MTDEDPELGALRRQVRDLEARIGDLEARVDAGTTHRSDASAPPPPAVPVRPAAASALWMPGQPVSPARQEVPSVQLPPILPLPPFGRGPAAPVAHDDGPATAGRSMNDLEERFAGRALAWVGGFALVAAAVFFLSLAFSRGWITEPMRVLIGIVLGAVAFTLGAVLLARRNELMGTILAGVGLGIVSIAILAATRLYDLVTPGVGLAGALVVSAASALVAVRFDARNVAAFGLVAALAAPPLVGASATPLTLGFLAATLVGATGVSLFRSWRWLPSLAFVLAAPQVASWVTGDAAPVPALWVLAAFWALNAVASAGEEARLRRNDLRPSSAILVLANASFLVWGLFATLDGDLAAWRGLAIAVAAAAHLLVGAAFVARQGPDHLFANLVAGTGAALVAIAAFVQLGAPVVPVAWAAEATALVWLAVRRRNAWSAYGALALGALAVTHLLVVEYPFWEARIPAAMTFDLPMLNAAAGSLGAVLLALVVAASIVPMRPARSALMGCAVLLVAWASAFELHAPPLATLLAALLPLGVMVDGLLGRWPDGVGMPSMSEATREAPMATAAGLVAWIAGAWVACAHVAPPIRLWVEDGRGPLAGAWPLPLIALAVAAIVATRLPGSGPRDAHVPPRALLDGLAGLVAIYLVSVAVVDVFARQVGGPVAVTELANQAQVSLSVFWSAIGAGLLFAGLARRMPAVRTAGFSMLAVASAKVFLIDLAAMDVAYRTLVLAGLGLLLLASAWVFTRLRGRSGAAPGPELAADPADPGDPVAT